MSRRWPPRALGLGPPLNLVVLSPELRGRFARYSVQSIAFAIAVAIAIAAVDQVFFDGATAERTPALDVHPTPQARIGITFVGGLLEELVFRLFVATAVAAVVWSTVRRVIGERTAHMAAARWTGTIAAALLVGAWHVWMVSDPASSDVRVLTINVLSNLLYGWTYWRRGLEMSTLTHGALNSTLYLGLPLLN